MQYEKHKFNFFPEIDSESFETLKQSIKKGFDTTLGKIILFEGKILDGWNRYKACIETDTTPVFSNFVGTEEEAFEFSIKANQERRHLSKSQLATIAIEAEPIWKAIQKKVEEERVEKIRQSRIKQEEERREKERIEYERQQDLIRKENERIKREIELKKQKEIEDDLAKKKEIEVEQERIKKEREIEEHNEKIRIENEKKQKEMVQLIVPSEKKDTSKQKN